jgi:inner membrane transporter RhtA
LPHLALSKGIELGLIVFGHQIAQNGGTSGIDALSLAMLTALVVVSPIGFTGALTVQQPYLLLAGIGVGICSSVIPYVCDQLAMARLPRPTFALLLSLLPASVAPIGIVVLGQIPTAAEYAGIGLVTGGVALHKARDLQPESAP